MSKEWEVWEMKFFCARLFVSLGVGAVVNVIAWKAHPMLSVVF